MGATWSGDTAYPVLAAQLALLGIGIGLTIAPTTSAVVDHAEPESRGAAAGVVMVVRMIGLSVGLSALTAWGLARFNARRGDIELPPITDPGFTDAVTRATEELTTQSIADTFVMSAVALGAGLLLVLALVRRPTVVGPAPNPSPHQEVTMTTPHDPTEPQPSEPDTTPTSDDAVPAPVGADDPVAHDAQGELEPSDESADDTVSTDEMPVLALRADDEVEPLPEDDRAAESWVHRNLTTVVGVFAVLLVGMIGLLAVALLQLSSTRDDLEQAQRDLVATQDEMNRVEAGAAIYASQINGFVETVNNLGPSIDGGLDQAIAGLETFGASTIEFTVSLDETVSISENFTIDRDVAVPINTTLPISTEFDTTITVDGPFGIDIPLDITVPVDVEVPIDLVVDIPINESLPIDVDVPVQLDVPIAIDVEGTELQQLSQSLIEGLRAFQAGLGDLTTG